MFSTIKNYIDFSSINSSVKYLSITAFFTGTVLGYFFTIIVFSKTENSNWVDTGLEEHEVINKNNRKNIIFCRFI